VRDLSKAPFFAGAAAAGSPHFAATPCRWDLRSRRTAAVLPGLRSRRTATGIWGGRTGRHELRIHRTATVVAASALVPDPDEREEYMKGRWRDRGTALVEREGRR
jgi:hypothetical protein